MKRHTHNHISPIAITALFIMAVALSCHTRRQASAVTQAQTVSTEAVAITALTAQRDTTHRTERRALTLDSLLTTMTADSVAITTPTGGRAVIYAPQSRRTAHGIQSATATAQSRQATSQAITEATGTATHQTAATTTATEQSETDVADPLRTWSFVAALLLTAGLALFIISKYRHRNDKSQ